MSNFEDAMDDARQSTENLCRIIESLEAENAELRAGRGRWPEQPYSHAVLPDGRVVPYEEAKHIKDGAIPVTAETIRQSEPGSTWEEPAEGEVFEWTGRQLRWQMGAEGLGKSDYINAFEDGELVRSTAAPRGDYSAPVKDVDTSAPSLKENGENFTRPLTVHKLNTAPVGSVVTGWGVDYTKHYDGQWCDNTGRLWSDGEVAGRTMVATLTHPERGDHE